MSNFFAVRISTTFELSHKNDTLFTYANSVILQYNILKKIFESPRNSLKVYNNSLNFFENVLMSMELHFLNIVSSKKGIELENAF